MPVLQLDGQGGGAADCQGIYDISYCQPLCIAEIDNQEIANKLLSLGVNVGVVNAARMLQDAVTVVGDGRIGPLTLHALDLADPEKVLADLRAEAESYYDALLKAVRTWPFTGRDGYGGRRREEMSLFFLIALICQMAPGQGVGGNGVPGAGSGSGNGRHPRHIECAQGYRIRGLGHGSDARYRLRDSFRGADGNAGQVRGLWGCTADSQRLHHYHDQHYDCLPVSTVCVWRCRQKNCGLLEPVHLGQLFRIDYFDRCK